MSNAQAQAHDRDTAQMIADALNNGSSDAEHAALTALADRFGLVFVEGAAGASAEGAYVLPGVVAHE